MPKGLTQKQTQKFKPYAVALANVIYSWNRLQTSLALILIWITGFSVGQIALAMWNAIPSDTTQRAMLLAALDAAEKEEFKTRSRARSDIKWIIKKANELAGKRNAAVHAPYQMERVKPFNLTTMQQFGNRLAKKLENKDLLTEFKWYSATADELHFFSLKILHALVFSHETWPDRPQLPRLDQFQTPKHKIHKKHSKQSQPPHGSLLH